MGGKQSRQETTKKPVPEPMSDTEVKIKKEAIINFFIASFLIFTKKWPEQRKKKLDIIDANNRQINDIQQRIKDIDNKINNKLIFTVFINDYHQIKKKYLDIVYDYNNLNKLILDEIKKINEKNLYINEIYKKTVTDKNFISNNIVFLDKEIKLFTTIINDNIIESTKDKLDILLFNLTTEYLNFKNSAACLDINLPHLYNDKCYSKCPINSSFNIDISGNPVCNKIEKIIEDKTVDKAVYKCPDGYIYKKEKNGKEFCISCPENYMYIKNENDNDYCLENCPSGYVLDKDNICKINKEYKLYQKENKDPEICPIGYSIKELNGNYMCIEDCQTGYVLDKDNICRQIYSPKEKNLCPSGYKLNKANNQYICFEDCPENYKLEKDNICKYVNTYSPIVNLNNYKTIDISCNNNYDYINGSCYKKCEQNYSTYSKDPTKCVIDTCVKPYERIEENNRIYCIQMRNIQSTPTYKNKNESLL